jgi:hypothetical protein
VQAELQRRGVGAPVSAKHALLFFVLATFLL